MSFALFSSQPTFLAISFGVAIPPSSHSPRIIALAAFSRSPGALFSSDTVSPFLASRVRLTVMAPDRRWSLPVSGPKLRPAGQPTRQLPTAQPRRPLSEQRALPLTGYDGYADIVSLEVLLGDQPDGEEVKRGTRRTVKRGTRRTVKLQLFNLF